MTPRVLLLNDWLGPSLRRAERLVEDSDRKARTDRQFLQLVRRVHDLATRGALATPRPTLERFQGEDLVGLCMEWRDRASNWSLTFGIYRPAAQNPYVLLDLCATIDKTYSLRDPTDDDINRALYAYFHDWKQR